MSNCVKSKRKLTKGQHPLKHFVFYLDIENYIASKQIEENIVELGGRIAFFFAETVTHIITDKTENKKKDNSNSLNTTLSTPVECIKSNDSKTKSRADEMLHRVRAAAGQQQQQQQEKNELNKDSSKNNLLLNTIISSNKLPSPSTSKPFNNSHIKESRIWDSKHAINIFNKLIDEKEKHKLNSSQKKNNLFNSKRNATHFKECYIKIESFEKFYRPYYKNFAKWPKINLKIKQKKLFNYQDTTVVTNTNTNTNNINIQNNLIINKLNNDNLNDNNKTIEDTQKNIKCIEGPFATATNCLTNNITNYNNLIEIEKGQLLNNNTAYNLNKTTTSESDEDNFKNKCGFCELCKIEYDNISTHLLSESHVKFSKNSQNYLELDTIINDKGLNLESFLKQNNLNLNSNSNVKTKTGINNENLIKSTNLNDKNLSEKKLIDLKSTNRRKSIDTNKIKLDAIANRTRKSIDKQNILLNEIDLAPIPESDCLNQSEKHSPNKISLRNFKKHSLDLKVEKHTIVTENLQKSIINNKSKQKSAEKVKKNTCEEHNFLERTATIKHNKNSVKMTKCNGINKNLTKRLKTDEILIDRHYFRETRQSLCKKNLYSITLPVTKATKSPIKDSKCNNSSKKSTVTTKKSSPKKKSYYEEDDDEDEDDDAEDDDDDDEDIDFIDKNLNLSAPANVFYNNLRSQQKPNNCSRPKRNSMSMYYKVINNKSSPKKETVATTVTSVVDSKPIPKKLPIEIDSKNTKANDKPSIIVKFKKIRQTELSVLNGEAENFMFPKRLEQRKRSTEDNSCENDEAVKKKIRNSESSIFNSIPPPPNINNFSYNSNCSTSNYNNNNNRNRSIIQFCSNEKILEKVHKTFLRGDIDKYRFAFEKVPRDELWYNVFRRQDTSRERIFEYYGNTAYRKLPYEMGPLPALECKDKCLTCRLMENNLFKNESPNQVIIKDKIDLKKELLDNQHQQQQVDDEKISNNSIEHEINKSTCSSDITTASKSNKKLIKRDSSKSLLEAYDIPRKSPREHASTLAILSCLLNSKNSSSGSETEIGTSQNINQKLINSDEPVILNYKRRPKKSLKLSKTLLENRINSTLTTNSNILDDDKTAYSSTILEQKELKKSNEQTNSNYIKRPTRPLHWKQKPKTYLDQNSTNGIKYENPVTLNLKINKFLESTTSIFPIDNLDITNSNSTALSIPIPDKNNFSFSNELNLIDLMDESLLKQQKLYFNKFNTSIVKKRKNNNKTGWPKKKKILTRQQKRKTSQCNNNNIEIHNDNIVISNAANIKTEFVSVETISSIEDNLDEKMSAHETDEDDDVTLKNDDYLSAESNLDDNEINSIEDEIIISCKYCGLSSNICDEHCNNVIADNKIVRTSPIKQELVIPTKQLPIKISPRKLRKPRGRWYRER